MVVEPQKSDIKHHSKIFGILYVEPIETSEPELVVEPEETSDPELVVEPEETTEPELVVEPEETSEPELVVEPEETTEPDLVVEPEETTEPELVVEPEETADPDLVVEPPVVTARGALPSFRCERAICLTSCFSLVTVPFHSLTVNAGERNNYAPSQPLTFDSGGATTEFNSSKIAKQSKPNMGIFDSKPEYVCVEVVVFDPRM